MTAELHRAVLVAKWIFFAATLIGFRLRGARAWVRWCTVLTCLCFFAEIGLERGVAAAVIAMLAIIAIFCGSMLYGTRRWRVLRGIDYEPADAVQWPPHAEADAEAFSRDLAGRGFSLVQSARMRWGHGAELREGVRRTFFHAASATGVVVTASARPKALSRLAISPAREGAMVVTSDRQSDYSALPVPFIRAAQVPQLSTTAELLEAHRRRLDGQAFAPENARELIAGTRGRWLDELIARGWARASGEWVSLTWKGSFLGVARILRRFLS